MTGGRSRTGARASSATRAWSARDQPVVGEHRADLLEARVGGRQDQVGVLEGLVGQRRADLAYAVQQLGQACVERLLVAGVDLRLDRRVELVEAVELGIGDLELSLAEDADDHDCSSFSAVCATGAVSVLSEAPP